MVYGDDFVMVGRGQTLDDLRKDIAKVWDIQGQKIGSGKANGK